MTEIDHFLCYLQSEDLTPGTIANYRGNLRLFGQWMTVQGKTISALTPSDLKQYKNHLQEKYKPLTINTKLGHLSSFLKWCQENGYISQNPVAKIKLVRSEQYARWLTPTQVEMILHGSAEAVSQAQAQNLDFFLTVSVRARAIAIILLNTGLRVSELCDLKMGDVSNGVIVVRWGKGSKRREVPMNEQAKAALDSWLTVRRSESDYIFCTWNGRITRQVVLWHLARWAKDWAFT